MCEANAYIDHEGKEELFMESVDIIKPEAENRLLIMNIFGDQKILHGKIKKISLLNHKILLEKIK
ncbi:MAG: CooT family nickel-binding protein [bacterium]|nr:CooT family nickel-binding protein [bacterium]